MFFDYNETSLLICILNVDLLAQEFQRLVAGNWHEGDRIIALFPNAEALLILGHFESGEQLRACRNPMIIRYSSRIGVGEASDNHENAPVTELRLELRACNKKFASRFERREVHVGTVAATEASRLRWSHLQIVWDVVDLLVHNTILVSPSMLAQLPQSKVLDGRRRASWCRAGQHKYHQNFQKIHCYRFKSQFETECGPFNLEDKLNLFGSKARINYSSCLEI